MIRTSTETQQVEDQHNEMVQFCKNHGYSEEQMVFVETQGASAFKVDDDYLDMIEQVKEHILEDRDIDCFAVWHLNRAARNEKMYVELKDFLVQHKVQFIVKNPYLRLLNDDGSINGGMELAFSLMATLAKQDNEERIAKFKRAKRVMRSQGKFIGGRCVKTGYKVNDDGYVVIDEEKAKLVRLVFELYATGEYSVRTLFQELVDRGYSLNYHLVNRIVADRTYIDGIYPQMVSQELWNRCEKVRSENSLFIPKGRRFCFGSGIFKCSKCGRYMIAEGDQYRCWHHNKYSAPPHCDNVLTIRVDNLDGLLWWVASKEEIKFRMKNNEDKRKEYEGKIEVLRQKISATKTKLDNLEKKRERIVDAYIDGMISKEEREKKLSGTSEQAKIYNDTILSFEERIEGFLTFLEGNNEDKITEEKLRKIYTGVIDESDLELMQEIVQKHICKVTTSAEWFGKERDHRAVRQNAQLVTIELVTGEVKKFIYVARKYKGHRFFFYKEDGREVPVLSVHKIKRDSIKGSIDHRIFKKLKDW